MTPNIFSDGGVRPTLPSCDVEVGDHVKVTYLGAGLFAWVVTKPDGTVFREAVFSRDKDIRNPVADGWWALPRALRNDPDA